MHTMEKIALTVEEVNGHSSVKSEAQLNDAEVLFVEKVAQVNLLVEECLGRFCR